MPVAPWSRGAVDTLEDALAAAEDIGYPLMLKATAGGGGRGIRMVASRRRPRGRLPAHQRRGAAGVRQRHRLPRAPGDRRPPRRGAADRRRPRHRLGHRRTRLLDPAPQPEGHRGVVLAAARRRADRRAQGVGRAARPRRRVRRRGHGRVPLPPRGARPSRSSRSTPGSRSSTRSPRPPPTSTWSRRRSTSPAAAGSRATKPAEKRARRRGTPQRRGPGPRLRAVARAASSGSTCRPDRVSGSTPASPRATRSRPTSTR